MTRQKTKEHVREQRTEHSGDDPFGDGPGNLQQQAAAYANIAHEARRDCEKGPDAERALAARRNRSGQ
jgi:hypothetical protein